MGHAHLLCLLVVLLYGSATRGVAIIGAGSALPAQVFADAQFAYRFENPNVELEYYASDSQAGVCRIESFADECAPTDTRAPAGLDFAVTTTVLNQTDYTNYPDLQLYPVLATPLVPIYNLNGVQGLVLAGNILALIFCGVITTWDDSRVKARNANFSKWNIPLRTPIQVVARLDSSDVTMLFKTALSDFYSLFTNYVDVSPRPSWGKVNVVLLEGQEAVNSYVLQNPWTISYSSLEAAINANVARVRMYKSTGVVVDASVRTTTFAVLELGLDFGNDGDNGTQLTANLNNARGVNGWPIVTYSYVALRTSTLRSGASCDAVRATVAFWQWFLTADIVQTIAESHYSVQPPSVVLDVVEQRLVSDVTCRGQPVAAAVQAPPVTAVGDAAVAHAIRGLAEVYAVDQPLLSLQYTPSMLNTSDAVAAALAANQFVAVRQPGLAPATGTATLLFAGVAVVVISRYDLVLDVSTLARILEGDIRTWLDPALTGLNPNGLRGPGGSNITNASQRIVLFNGPTSASGDFHSLMRRSASNFVGAALRAAPYLATEQQLRTVVAGTPFALAVTTSALDTPGSLIKFASLQRSAGVVVAPTPAAIGACAASASDTTLAGLDLAASSSAACYPLSLPVYLVVPTPQCNATIDSVTLALAFLLWAFRDNNTAAALEGFGLALLAVVSPAAKAANALALASLSCSTAGAAADTSSVDVAPIVAGGCIGAFVVLAIPGLWYVRKSRRDMQALQKQVSDVKVAEDCAEAIACFDMEAVSWLADLAKPTKIQLAFLHIVTLLVEVKPFIPDQLMAQLQAVKDGEEPPKGHARRPPRGTGDDRTTSASSRASVHSSLSSRTVVVAHGHETNNRAPVSAADDPSGVRRAGRGARVSDTSLGSHADRFRRTCTYMFVRFVIEAEHEADKHGQLATAVAAHVVTLGKGHGATIDKVTYDSVALHWNVSAQCAGAPLQAAALAMELACMEQTLPAGFAGDVRLLVGIGHGPSTVATVSAAGQRFFVVGGPEIANAVDVVMQEVAVPLGCTILLSSAVQQEVKYGFRCCPRLWFRDVLFWEPVERRGCKKEDEWMYQIKSMEEDDATLEVGRALHDVFLLARAGQSAAILQREVRHVQQHFAAQLSPQDLASLRCLHDTSVDDCLPTV